MEKFQHKLSRQQWVMKGLEVLEKEGHHKMSIERIARKLNVTRGSFYYHFKSRLDFIHELLTVYETVFVDAYLDDALKELSALKILQRYLKLSSKSCILEIRMQAWSLEDELVCNYLERVENKRLQIALELAQAIVQNDDHAKILGTTAHLLLIGTKQTSLRKHLDIVQFLDSIISSKKTE